ncbi:YeeE/YedE family protein [Marinobacterium sp. AK62]|uniref:YeeE/YedE family protein n=1 Tax=Marinobacterium alkalitolerans TaxID=1542925 RepID=A0ABS3Z7X5_9GAMM|nr:YeeE/YedE family protein [Marinobacterium alkalitolerans]MBP0047816.1 YeeE/YedE family protein [Marinobacterium alkalitolerans]
MSAPTLTATNASPLLRQPVALAASIAALTGLFTYLAQNQGQHSGLVMLLGAALGVALYHASFGFTTAWRTFVTTGRGRAIRAQMLMLAVAVCLFFPALAAGELFGQQVFGFVRPLSVSVVFGAFIFGIGMQIANGCASGNLYHAGGGQLRAIPSMIGFAAGALWATHDYEWWTTQPSLAPVDLIELLGLAPAIALNLAVFAAIALLTRAIEKRRHGAVEADDAGADQPLSRRLLSGPWPFIWGAVALAVLNFATLAMIGRPWAVALAYPLWGAKAAEAMNLGLDVDFWGYWLMPGRDTALMGGVLDDSASLMNIGVILGALVAATLAGRFSLSWKMPLMQWVAAILGGLMLGYGATIAFGCNIGAFFGGIASGSLHGWLWLVAAFAGSFVGTWFRPLFRLPRT